MWRLTLKDSINIAISSVPRSLPAFSTTISRLAQDPACLNEAPIIDNERVLGTRQTQEKQALEECTITVPQAVSDSLESLPLDTAYKASELTEHMGRPSFKNYIPKVSNQPRPAQVLLALPFIYL